MMSAMRKSEGRRTKHEKSSPFVIRHSSLTLIALLTWSMTSAVAQSTNAPSRLDYNSFRMISDRNIFNPNRRARSPSGTTRTDSRPASRVEAFTLVGLMAYEKGVFAFFDGTSGNYKKTLEVNGDISGFQAVEVTPDQLKLVTGTNEFVMRVGMQVRREDEGDWFLTEASQPTRNRVVVSRARLHSASGAPETDPASIAEAGAESMPEIIILEPETTGETPGANGNAETATNGDGAANNGITDPVLLRLMQRRQEMSQ
jgi:hypothetical protein